MTIFLYTSNKSIGFNLSALLLLTLFFLSNAGKISAQDNVELIYNNCVYRESIKTALIYPSGISIGDPVVELNGLSLTVRFDDLDADYKDFYYTVIHCNKNWSPSDLDKSDYMEGFFSNPIDEYEQSFNTLKSYTHYQFEFPNEMSRLKISGNYLLYVYEDEDEENLVLSKRFVVYENKVVINSIIGESTVVSNSRYYQEVDVTVNTTGFNIIDPYDNFSISILQNGRWDNAKTNLSPRFVKNTILDFDYGEENNFKGQNEFRNFDIKDMDYISLEVDHNGIIDRTWHSWLRPDERRAFKVYRTDRDLNGKYFVRNDDGFEPHLEEEYVWVHFSLPFEVNLHDNELYIFGSLSQFRYLDEFRMTYNESKKAYEAVVLLKQGYYNYLYLAKDSYEETGDPEVVEGTQFATENNYSIICYYTDFFEGYDRVVGYQLTNNYK